MSRLSAAWHHMKQNDLFDKNDHVFVPVHSQTLGDFLQPEPEKSNLIPKRVDLATGTSYEGKEAVQEQKTTLKPRTVQIGD